MIPYGDVKALEAAITPNTAAFMVEPLQGEGGVIVPPDGYLAQAADICKSNNVLLVVDEIQTGLGRTGKMFCSEWDDVKPDVMIVGKALSGGMYPVSSARLILAAHGRAASYVVSGMGAEMPPTMGPSGW